jgi:Na+-transporting methylmalonyl-CoA/oxaloacetate decarboxylase beta subunit
MRSCVSVSRLENASSSRCCCCCWWRLLLPAAAPLLGMFCFGNLMRECGVVDRLSDTAQNSLINIVTIFLGLAVGSKLAAESSWCRAPWASGARHGGVRHRHRERRADGQADEPGHP